MKHLKANEARKKEQAEKGFDALTYFVYRSLLDAEVDEAETVSEKIKAAFVESSELAAKRGVPAGLAAESHLRDCRAS